MIDIYGGRGSGVAIPISEIPRRFAPRRLVRLQAQYLVQNLSSAFHTVFSLLKNNYIA